MPIAKPYRRTCRQLLDGSYANNGNGEYVSHPKFAQVPAHLFRAFLVLQKDFITLLDYIEPADGNLRTYSYRVHELLMRTCVEVEAQCRTIFADNGYGDTSKCTMMDYPKLEVSHRLSSYRAKLPLWSGDLAIRTPFETWSKGGPLTWYQAYNRTKHNRHENFEDANFGALVDAMCGLIILHSAQFRNEDFGRACYLVEGSGLDDGFDQAAGNYFLVGYPYDWPPGERYEFDWTQLRDTPDPF
jgi:hypothetical protein